MSRVTIKQVSQYVKLRLLSVVLQEWSLDQQHHTTKEHESNRFSGLTPAILNQKLWGWVSGREVYGMWWDRSSRPDIAGASEPGLPSTVAQVVHCTTDGDAIHAEQGENVAS